MPQEEFAEPQKKYCCYCQKKHGPGHFNEKGACKLQAKIDAAHAKAASRLINTGRSY